MTQENPEVAEGNHRSIVTLPIAALAIGLLIFVVNMGFAWWMALNTNSYIQRPLLSQGGESQLVLSEMRSADLAQSMIYRRIIEGNLHMKAISNKQTTVVVGMGAGFGFLAVGFSLVIMAIRGAFELGAKLPNRTGELVLRSASPGVLCFMLGALIMIVALVQETTLQFGGMGLEMTSTSEKKPPPDKSTQAPDAVPIPLPLSFENTTSAGDVQ